MFYWKNKKSKFLGILFAFVFLLSSFLGGGPKTFAEEMPEYTAQLLSDACRTPIPISEEERFGVKNPKDVSPEEFKGYESMLLDKVRKSQHVCPENEIIGVRLIPKTPTLDAAVQVLYKDGSFYQYYASSFFKFGEYTGSDLSKKENQNSGFPPPPEETEKAPKETSLDEKVKLPEGSPRKGILVIGSPKETKDISSMIGEIPKESSLKEENKDSLPPKETFPPPPEEETSRPTETSPLEQKPPEEQNPPEQASLETKDEKTDFSHDELFMGGDKNKNSIVPIDKESEPSNGPDETKALPEESKAPGPVKKMKDSLSQTMNRVYNMLLDMDESDPLYKPLKESYDQSIKDFGAYQALAEKSDEKESLEKLSQIEGNLLTALSSPPEPSETEPVETKAFSYSSEGIQIKGKTIPLLVLVLGVFFVIFLGVAGVLLKKILEKK